MIKFGPTLSPATTENDAHTHTLRFSPRLVFRRWYSKIQWSLSFQYWPNSWYPKGNSNVDEHSGWMTVNTDVVTLLWDSYWFTDSGNIFNMIQIFQTSHDFHAWFFTPEQNHSFLVASRWDSQTYLWESVVEAFQRHSRDFVGGGHQSYLGMSVVVSGDATKNP